MQDQIRSENALVIDEPELLNALIKAIWTLKYDSIPDDVQEFVSSPSFAELTNRVYDCLTALYIEQGQIANARELVESRSMKKSTLQLSVLPAHVRSIQKIWDGWDTTQRSEYVRLFMTPTVVTNDDISHIIESLHS